MPEEKFQIGLCMAGAISAGAYTAGVVDYLLEALENWETAKRQRRPDVPTHAVEIPVCTGASAGGITAVLTARSALDWFPHLTPGQRQNPTTQRQNPLYHAWVNLVADAMLPVLLDTRDLHDHKPVSLLNSDFIITLAEQLVTPKQGDVAERPYVAYDLEVLVTLSNLDGIPYELGFLADAPVGTRYLSKSHADFGHFILRESYQHDGRIPLSFTQNLNLDVLRACAMATSAFPVGLAYRTVTRDLPHVSDNRYINKLAGTPGLHLGHGPKYTTLNVDGGLLNNEPFEVTFDVLRQRTGQNDAALQSYHTSRGTILLIDPFPSSVPAAGSSDPGLAGVVGRLLNTLQEQVRFKPDDIEQAMDPHNASRYMIVPKLEAKYGGQAMACGALGGFSGFLCRAFREHDFYLGRRNCQRFLREVFTVPADTPNPLFVQGYAHPAARARFRAANGFLPIIPDMGYHRTTPTAEEEVLPPWPTIASARVQELEALIGNRFTAVVKGSLRLTSLDRLLLTIGLKVLITRKVRRTVIQGMLQALRHHELLAE